MKKNHPHKAFSLIELSIVILIIGILIAGVTQSSRMISAYKLSVARNITRNSPIFSIPDLYFWLDATSEKAFLKRKAFVDNYEDSFEPEPIELSNGDNIDSWQDYNFMDVVNHRHRVCELIADLVPSYASNAINGLPAARFNSEQSTMGLNCVNADLNNFNLESLNLSNTIFIVLKWTSTAASGESTVLFIDDADYNPDVYTPTTNFIKASISSGGNFTILNQDNSSVLSSVSYSGLKSGVSQILTMYTNTHTNVSKIFLNGSNVATSTAPPSGLMFGRIYIGGNGVDSLGGDIGEVIIFNRALKNEERAAVEKYLGQKWGIKIS